ncbi:MAG: hypothetical protein PHQ11_13030, partial [Paludibacter sp.]|nr:hypothetical protein [Paludibacter sp.]
MKLVMPKIFKKNSEDRKIKADTKLEPKFCLKKFIDRLVKHEKITDEKTTVYNKAAIIEIPPFNEKDTLLDQYWLIPPHAYATICKDKKNRIHYHITEPKLTDKEFVILE